MKLLPIGLLAYVVTVVGIGVYVYEGTNGVFFVFGYGLPAMLVIAAIAFLSVRKSKEWTISRTTGLVLILTALFLIAVYLRQIIEVYETS